MKQYLILFAILFLHFCNAQQNNFAELYKDSLKWESENKSWAKELELVDKFYNKLSISHVDSTISLIADIKKDHRIFGFKDPNIKSKKLILFSIWTHDVEGNPCDCIFGSYYQTLGVKDLDLKYLGRENDFIIAGIYLKSKLIEITYFEKKWTEFEN